MSDTPAVRIQPFVSVAMITRDEESNIRACIESVREFADEIVVHDTGSTDGTVEILRELGVHVIEGEWHDNFADARNVALDACRGTWVLSIDADERLEIPPGADARRLRMLLGNLPAEVGDVQLCIVNLAGSRLAPVRPREGFHSQRLFRRAHRRWQGRIHEMPLPIDDDCNIAIVWSDVVILHEGYLTDTWDARNKTERNLELALRRVEDDETAIALFEQARAMCLAQRHREAIEIFEKVIAAADCDLATRRISVRFIADIRLNLWQLDEAEAQLQRLRKLGMAKGVCDVFEARVALARGDGVRALRLLNGIHDYSINFAITEEAEVAAFRALARLQCDDLDGAVVDALQAIAQRPDLDDAVMILASGYEHDVPDVPTRLANAMTPEHLLPLAGRVLAVEPSTADAFCEALWRRFGAAPVLVAVAKRMADRVESPERASVWIERAGLVTTA